MQLIYTHMLYHFNTRRMFQKECYSNLHKIFSKHATHLQKFYSIKQEIGEKHSSVKVSLMGFSLNQETHSTAREIACYRTVQSVLVIRESLRKGMVNVQQISPD